MTVIQFSHCSKAASLRSHRFCRKNDETHYIPFKDDYLIGFSNTIYARISGPTLIREGDGTSCRVHVPGKTSVFRGKVWRSLSGTACEITGAKWNRPTFFGLR
ncbi:MAG: hypothetical protein CVT83_05255 [Alphaproteobacteria bacterium HGW-Alphaproteobacteria-5]|nr:MAG: hypothetical protein CVT83_05255 [Alphaproteobacteria bacterium HGW-Alphaproteobacteria-5]